MLLKEFIYFDDDKQMDNKDRHDPSHDKSPLKTRDLRKSRLTLKMLNTLRKAGDSREKEKKEELELVKKMYAQPRPEQGGMPGL